MPLRQLSAPELKTIDSGTPLELVDVRTVEDSDSTVVRGRFEEALEHRDALAAREALLAGHAPAPNDMDDPAFVDLLAENRGAGWLACVGALRRLWPVPPANASELTLPLPPVPDDEEARSREFWTCLQCVVASARNEPAAVAARKRMKQLDADLHAQFMKQGVWRDQE